MLVEIGQATLEHLGLSLAGVGIGIVAGIPLGILVKRSRSLGPAILGVIDVLQTIPSLALLALLMLWLGLGNNTLVVALAIYSLLPIVRNTYIGLSSVDQAVVEAGRGMGTTRWQLLTMVQLPIALPAIMAGVRIALVTAIGIATIGVLIGSGGLGMLIWRGLQQMDTRLIVSGAVPAALLALAVDWLLGWTEDRLTPRGLKTSSGL